jgi:hypothetical protein
VRYDAATVVSARSRTTGPGTWRMVLDHRGCTFQLVPQPDHHSMRIRSFADMQLVVAVYLNGHTVELCLDDIDRDLARRATDFATGMVFATGGKMTSAGKRRLNLIPPEASDDSAPGRP